ncbi:MAG: BACON domain-containing protein [Prevotellaceae bacterium]|jgi:hypothetical protein|nr:BACON domain-containing protein [Prevotellaceae bacterium]
MKIFKAYIFLTAIVCFFSCNEKEEETNSTSGIFVSLYDKNASDTTEKELTEITADFQAQSYILKITGGIQFTAASYNSWCKVSPASGEGNDTLRVTLEANMTGEDRSTTVEISPVSGAKGESKSIAITQLYYTPKISIDKPTINLSSDARTVEIVVKTTLPKWYIRFPAVSGWTNKSGTSFTRPAGSPTEWETTVKFELNENFSPFTREAIVSFEDNDVTVTAECKITQPGPQYVFFDAAGGQQQKEALSGAWTALSSADWCAIQSSGNGGDISFTVTSNTALLPRRAIVTLTGSSGTKKIAVSQEPRLVVDANQKWTEASGTVHTSIPADKKYWNEGEVLEYKHHTKGNGVKIVFFNDAFNKLEMAVGGAYENATKELTDMFFKMPVIREYKEYFDIYILMTVWEKSGLYNQFPNGGYKAPYDGRSSEFRSRINVMPQLQSININGNVTGFYVANGMAGGYMSTISGMNFASYPYNAESGPPGWMIHEFMGHAFANLGDQYNEHSSTDISDWNFYLKSAFPVNPASNDEIGEYSPSNYVNNRIVEWNQEAWDAFISLPGNSQYASNLESEYRRPLPSNYREKHPNYTGGDYIWRTNRPDDFMVNHGNMRTTGYDRYLVYRRIKRLAGEQYSLVDFFAKDQVYANTTDRDQYEFLGLSGWSHGVNYDPHATTGSPFQPWDVNSY